MEQGILTGALAEGKRIHHNFVRPHIALEGQTPAEATGIGLNEGNKWMELLKRAVEAGEHA